MLVDDVEKKKIQSSKINNNIVKNTDKHKNSNGTNQYSVYSLGSIVKT